LEKLVSDPYLLYLANKNMLKLKTYPWSFVTQIFHNGQPSHGGDKLSCYKPGDKT